MNTHEHTLEGPLMFGEMVCGCGYWEFDTEATGYVEAANLVRAVKDE